MIDPRALREFIQRERDSWNWLKELPRKDVLWALEGIRPRPNIEALDLHQLVMLLVGIRCGHFAFWAGPGTGKTLVCFRLFEFWHDTGEMERGLTTVPSMEAVVSWEDEANKWRFKLPLLGLADDTSTSKAERWLDFGNGVLVIAYPSLSRLTCGMEPERKKDKRTGLYKETGRMRLAPRPKAIELLAAKLGMVVWDESTELMNDDSLQFRIARQFHKRVPHRFALAGRPFGRKPEALWAQQYLVDGGASLGLTLGMLRAALFDAKKKYFGGPYSFNYKLKKGAEPELRRLSDHRAIRYSTEECVDLPPLVERKIEIKFPATTLDYYTKVVEHLIAARGDRKVVQNDFLRLRQLSSGFLGVANDEYGAKATIEFDKNPKLDMLIELLRQVPEGQKTIVPYFFTWSGEQICARLRKAKIMHTWMWSGASDRRSVLHKFQNDPRYEVLVMNWAIGAMSLNLQAARYMAIYESPISSIDRDQLIRRFWRKGQAHRCMLWDLVMKDSADQRILDFIAEGDSLWEAVQRDPKKALLGRRK